jgi:hypothetical protein
LTGAIDTSQGAPEWRRRRIADPAQGRFLKRPPRQAGRKPPGFLGALRAGDRFSRRAGATPGISTVIARSVSDEVIQGHAGSLSSALDCFASLATTEGRLAQIAAVIGRAGGRSSIPETVVIEP